MTSPFPSLSINVFHHFKGFFHIYFYLLLWEVPFSFLATAPLFVIFTALSLHITPAPVCPWEMHPLASGRGVPICVPAVAFLGEGLSLAPTAAYQPGSAALTFCNSCLAHKTQLFPPPHWPRATKQHGLAKKQMEGLERWEFFVLFFFF